MLKVKVDHSLCIGTAACAAVAPNVFDLNDEGKSVVKKRDGISSADFTAFSDINDTQDNIQNAAKSCPVDSIVIVEVDENEKEIRQAWSTK